MRPETCRSVVFPEVKKCLAEVDFWGHFREGVIAVTIHDIYGSTGTSSFFGLDMKSRSRVP